MIALTLGLAIVSCKKDDPIIPDQQEVITTLKYTLTPKDGGDAVEFLYKDLSGVGTGATIINGSLKANTEYSGAITLLNETLKPDEEGYSVTKEVEEDDLNHQFFFTTPAGLTIDYADKDENGHPIGLKNILTTDDSFKGGDLTIVLRHQPNKEGENVNKGDIANAGGETDIDKTFTVSLDDK